MVPGPTTLEVRVLRRTLSIHRYTKSSKSPFYILHEPLDLFAGGSSEGRIIRIEYCCFPETLRNPFNIKIRSITFNSLSLFTFRIHF